MVAVPRFTSSDLECLPDRDDVRYEIIDGELYVSKAPHRGKLYSRQGVEEYWIIDWQLRTVQVYHRTQEALELTATLLGDDVLTSPLLPGFSCPLSSLWEPPIDA